MEETGLSVETNKFARLSPLSGEEEMKLFLISQTYNVDYDTYDSAVVAAPTEAIAKTMHPSEFPTIGTWCPTSEVFVEYIGEAKRGTKQGVICASFNAG